MLGEGADLRGSEGGVFHLLDLLTHKDTMVDPGRGGHGGMDSAVDGLAPEENTMSDLKVGAEVEFIAAEGGNGNAIFDKQIFGVFTHETALIAPFTVVVEDPFDLDV